MQPSIQASTTGTVGRRAVLGAALAAAASGQARAAMPVQLDRAGLVPTFSDDFDSFSRWDGHAGTWRTVYGYGGPLSPDNRFARSSHEKQVYMDPDFGGTDGGAPIGIDPFAVEGGVLRIEAKPLPAALRPRLFNQAYSSGLITTRFSFSQLYGHFEARAKLPAGRGMWPAFWLLPSNDRWPPEIDVFEMLGRDPTTIYVTLHETGKTWQENQSLPVRVPDTSAGFHTYGLSWGPEEIRWYFDDREIARKPTPREMHVPMYMLLNLAVGGTWGGDPDEGTRFPAHMLIDWVRAYRFARG